jgi:hypothetical protein
MELFLAIIGLFTILGAGIALGVWGQRLLQPAPPTYRPRGIKVTDVNPNGRYIAICADPQSVKRLARHGRIAHEFTDELSGDDHWGLWVPELLNFTQVTAEVMAIAKAGERE